MSNTQIRVSLPLDSGFLRRECPLCMREFKVLLSEDEVDDLASKGLDSFLIEPSVKDVEPDETRHEPDEAPEYVCPYCGQRAPQGKWWTQEQHDYMRTFVKNMAARMVNEQLRRLGQSSRRFSGGLVSITVKTTEIREEEPWMAPETDDMKVRQLPCCDRKLKVDLGWKGTVHCYFCGFPHPATVDVGTE